MDQVKVALAILKKQHFWILCGLIIIPSVVVWKMAVGSVDAQFETRKGVLDGQLSKIEGIKGDSAHPNQDTIKAIDGETRQLNKLVFGVWQNLYDNQQKLNPWPEELGAGFIDMVNVLPKDKEIPTRYREDYQVFIANHLPMLDEIIKRLRPKELEPEENSGKPTEMGVGMENAGSRGPVEYEGIVEWAAGNRNNVRAPFIWETRPSTAKIRVAQEDLWIYEALLRVIAKTNASATGNFNAAVKRIEYMNIGQAAGGLSQGSSMSGGGMGMEMGGMEMGGMEMGGMEMGGMEMGGMEMGGMEMGGMASSGPSEEARLLDGRYVDQDGKPLGAGDVPPYAEFKMMPVRLRLVVEQGKISDLLVNCANCTMPIDVRRVSLWSKGGASGFNIGGTRGMGGGMDMGMGGGMDMGMGGGMDMGMGGGMDMGMGGGMDMGMGGGMDMGMGGNRRASVDAAGARREQLVLVNQKDIPVEIEGIIYIFNKPALEIMGTGSEEGAAKTAADGVEPPVETKSTPVLPTETPPSEATPEPAAPAGAEPAVDTAPTAPATPLPPPASGQGGAQPAATQPAAGEVPVTP